MNSILERLQENALKSDKLAWSFLNDKGDVADSYTYKELHHASGALAEHLIQSHKFTAGDRVLLVFFPGLDFTVSLLACFKAGLIAVPVFPPDPRKLKKDLHHFVNIQLSCGACKVLTNSQYNVVKKVEALKSIFSTEKVKWPELEWIQVDEVLKKGKKAASKQSDSKVVPGIDLPIPSMDQIAFLQYTSGSTSEPKGVMISHGNLAHNLTLIIRELRANESTINVSWLPQYHDMGLIGSYLGVIYCGGTGYYLSPISFLKDAVVWITAMSKYRCTHTQAPNFAYALATRKFKEAILSDSSFASKRSLDLSTLQHMINAAEPVDYKAIADFYGTFSPYGLPNDVVIPTYGLAEHTVFVCSGGKQVLTVTKASLEQGQVEVVSETRLSSNSNTGVDNNEHQLVVGCGYPGNAEGVEVIIVESATNEIVGDDTVGEIWINSPSKAQGYWGKPEVTQLEFQAIPNNQTNSSGGYLCTGDLGFMHSGELFICGRSKDLIIVRGSNHYPQDIERTAEQAHSTLLRPGCSAAFSVSSDTSNSDGETVVYIAELKEGVKASEYERLTESCREQVSKQHGLSLSVICLLSTRSVPKTTSGKIARAWCRRGYLENTLEVVYKLDATSRLSHENLTAETDTNKDESLERKAGGYKKLDTEEASSSAVVIQDYDQGNPPLSQAEVRSLPLDEIASQLEKLLIQVASQGPAPIASGSIDRNAPVSSLGLDSMTVVQYKGVLEKKFFCDMPDDFLFTNIATLNEIARSVKEGKLTEDQQKKYDSTGGAAANGKSGENPDDPEAASTVMVVTQREPCCPWFTCCY